MAATLEEKINFIESETTTVNQGLYMKNHKEGNTDIYLNNRSYGFKYVDKFRTVAGRVFKEYEAVEDRSTITAEDFSVIKMNQCRCCKGPNTEPYSEKFYKITSTCLVLYCFNNGYCRKCAEGKAAQKPKFKTPELKRKYSHHLTGDRYETTVYEFEGFTVYSNDEYRKEKI